MSIHADKQITKLIAGLTLHICFYIICLSELLTVSKEIIYKMKIFCYHQLLKLNLFLSYRIISHRTTTAHNQHSLPPKETKRKVSLVHEQTMETTNDSRRNSARVPHRKPASQGGPLREREREREKRA